MTVTVLSGTTVLLCAFRRTGAKVVTEETVEAVVVNLGLRLREVGITREFRVVIASATVGSVTKVIGLTVLEKLTKYFPVAGGTRVIERIVVVLITVSEVRGEGDDDVTGALLTTKGVEICGEEVIIGRGVLKARVVVSTTG